MLRTLLFLCFTNIASFVFVTSSTSYLLVFSLKVEDTKIGSTLGYLETADQVASLLGCSLWGMMSETMSEFVVCIVGLLLMSFGLILHPVAITSIPTTFLDIPRSLLLARVIFSIGGSATVTMLTAYSANVSKTIPPTKVSSYLGISSGLGAIFSAFFLNRLPALMKQYSGPWSVYGSFFVMVVVILLTALSVFISFPRKSEHELDCVEQEISQKSTFTASLSGFIARINSVAPHLFMPLWITGHCRSYLPNEQIAELTKRMTSSVLGTCQLAALATAPIIGFSSKRVKAELALIFVTGVGGLAYTVLFCISPPNSIYGYICAGIIGVVEIGTIILSLSFFMASYGSSRGKRSGIYALAGSIGIIYISNVGGYMSDTYGRAAPFLVIAYTNLIFAAMGAISLINDSKTPGVFTI
jgi:MFS family permease